MHTTKYFHVYLINLKQQYSFIQNFNYTAIQGFQLGLKGRAADLR